jgi:hypothetical protein
MTRRPKSTFTHLAISRQSALGEVHRGLVLSCTPSLEVVLDQVVWGIFWKVFRRSCRLPTRSVGPTDSSASLLVGRTHLSGTAVSLVGGDPGVPMSHRFELCHFLNIKTTSNTKSSNCFQIHRETFLINNEDSLLHK